MDTNWLIKLQVVLEPVGQPWIAVNVDGWGKTQQLTESTKFDFDFYTTQSACDLKIEHFKKPDNDPATAVIIKEISFFGITDPKFIWSGIYRPDYPTHYPDKVPEITNITCLGWNGVWTLNFSVPVFTWIHRIQNLGWIYE